MRVRHSACSIAEPIAAAAGIPFMPAVFRSPARRAIQQNGSVAPIFRTRAVGRRERHAREAAIFNDESEEA